MLGVFLCVSSDFKITVGLKVVEYFKVKLGMPVRFVEVRATKKYKTITK